MCCCRNPKSLQDPGSFSPQLSHFYLWLLTSCLSPHDHQMAAAFPALLSQSKKEEGAVESDSFSETFLEALSIPTNTKSP